MPSGPRPVDSQRLANARRKAIALFELGLSQVQVSKQIGISRVTVNKWHAKYRAGGAEQVMRQPGPRGRERKLNDTQLATLRKLLLEGPVAHRFQRAYWIHADIARLIERHFGVEHRTWVIPRLLSRAGVDASNCPSLSRPPRQKRGPRGRPRRLSLDEIRGLEDILRQPPSVSGLSALEWTPAVVANLLRTRFAARYSPSYIRPLLRHAGINADAVLGWRRR